MKIVVGLSGGVDSSVVAALLKAQGHDVIGVTMQLCDQANPHPGKGCFCMSQLDEIETARRIAQKLGIEHHVIDCSKEYADTILKYFTNEYKAGNTPNPCVICNAKFKFGLLLKLIEEKIGKFDKFATGHYARVLYSESVNCYSLHAAHCREKDQSYFLSRLTQEQLAKVMFPLGEFESKEDVRALAVKYELETAEKEDSQDFYSGNKAELIEDETFDLIRGECVCGRVVDINGNKLGHHGGYWKYTIGQRHGFSCKSADPMYVLKILPETNTLVVGTKDQTYRSSFKVKDINWITADPSMTITVDVKIRSSGSNFYHCSLGMDGHVVCLESGKQMFGVTPGQFAVFYCGDMVVGSGVICQVN